MNYKVPLNSDLGAEAKKEQKEDQRKIDEAEVGKCSVVGGFLTLG